MGSHTDPNVCTNRRATEPYNQQAIAAANSVQPSCSNYEERKRWMDAYIANHGAWVCECPEGREPSGPVETCPCPSVQIEINNTPTTDDDYVQLRCTRPARRHNIPCRIRATGGGSGSSTIVLTNPDGRLRFPGPTDTTKTLTVPHSGTWVPFQISGENASNALNDAVIEAHCDTEAGALKGSKAVTVFWFDQASIDVTPVGTYGMVGDRFTATGGDAVTYSAEARIRPAGVNCSAPQVQDLSVGIMQNLEPPYQKLKTWSAPTVAWDPAIPSGTSVQVPTAMRLTISVPVRTNDSATSVAPLYDQPGKADTLDPNSLRPPSGCANSGAATSSDTPSTPFPVVFSVPAQDGGGNPVGTVNYTRDSVELRKQFLTWCVVFNTSNDEYCALKERPWRLSVSSTGPAPQMATADAERDPTIDPVLAPPFGNARTNDPANHTTAPVGPGTTTITKP
jgi:hypothetical protein